MTTEPQRDDPATVFAAGALAAVLAIVCHETIGHGLGCRLDGGRITLLTAIWFRCAGAGSLTDLGGMLASMAVGVAGLAWLACPRLPPTLRLVVLMTGGISLLWGAGQLIVQPALGRDDLFFVARRLGWSWHWRPLIGLAGIVIYALSVWAIGQVLRRRPAPAAAAIRRAYAASVATAAAAGALWVPAPWHSAVEAAQTLGILPLGMLAAVPASNPLRVGIARSPRWICGALAILMAFMLLQARGVGALAGTGLPG